jgi:hypothetical protein
MGKLLVKVSVEGMEEAMVVVMAVAGCVLCARQP